MMEAIGELSADTTIILVEQNFLVASQLANRYFILDEGQSVKTGLMAELKEDRETIQKYLGTG
jgi:branched-chain amino acid transport system ATP-binding protein